MRPPQTITPWMHRGEPLTELPKGAVGFLYLIIAADGRMYIGRTFAKTWRRYKGGGVKLYEYYGKHGIDGVRFYALMMFDDPEKLEEAERRLIEITGAQQSNRYFNIREGGGFGGRHRESSIQKMRAAKLGKKYSKESSEKKRKAMLGRKASPETCKKIGDRHRNKEVSQATRDLLSSIFTGRVNGPHSEETKQKQREAATGRKHTKATKQKLRVIALNRPASPRIGYKHSAETKQKIREKQLGTKQSPEHIAKRVAATKRTKAKKKGRPQAASRFMSVEMTIPI